MTDRFRLTIVTLSVLALSAVLSPGSADAQGESSKNSSQATKSEGEGKKGPEAKALPKVLEPSQFYGAAAMGYAAAKACPEVQAKLFCYCGCDVTESPHHSSLLDCFTSFHGVDCHICQEEAVLALRMHRDGSSLKDIQEKVDRTYSGQYPFEKDSDNYKRYKATRLWNPLIEDGDNSQNTKAGPPTVKPGAKVGECCSTNHKKKDKKGENSK